MPIAMALLTDLLSKVLVPVLGLFLLQLVQWGVPLYVAVVVTRRVNMTRGSKPLSPTWAVLMVLLFLAVFVPLLVSISLVVLYLFM